MLRSLLKLVVAPCALVALLAGPPIASAASYFGTRYGNGPASQSPGPWCCGSRASIQVWNPDVQVGDVDVDRVFAQGGPTGTEYLIQVGFDKAAGPDESGNCAVNQLEYFEERYPINGLYNCTHINNAAPGARHKFSVWLNGTWAVYIDGTVRGAGTSWSWKAYWAAAGGEIGSSNATHNWGWYGGSGSDTTGAAATQWQLNDGSTWTTIGSSGTHLTGAFHVDPIGGYGGANGWRSYAN